MASPQRLVITGSTRGLGFGFAGALRDTVLHGAATTLGLSDEQF